MELRGCAHKDLMPPLPAHTLSCAGFPAPITGAHCHNSIGPFLDLSFYGQTSLLLLCIPIGLVTQGRLFVARAFARSDSDILDYVCNAPHCARWN